MKISGVDIRPGNIIEYEGGIWRAVKIQHTQPGKGGAYMQVEMKNLIDGRKNNVRFRSAETVERVRLDTKDFQFLFHDGDMLTFMDKDNYEQITLPRGPARRRRRLPPGRHGRGHGALQRAADLGPAARHDRSDDRRGRRGGEGPDRLVQLQAGGARQWRPVMVPPHISAARGSSSTSTTANTSAARTEPMVSHSGLITVMQRAARKAAPRLRRDFGEVEQLQVSRKGPADFVSMADKRAEQTIVEELRNARPDWGMLLEEGGEIAGNPDKPRWIVDPLDGTTNFLHGIPHFSISIAVEEPKPGGGTRDHPGPGLPAADRRELLGGEGPGRLAQGRAGCASPARRDLADA